MRDVLIEYGTEAVSLAYNNPEATSAIIAVAVTLLYRYEFKGNWPLFNSARRFLLPLASATIGKAYPIEFTRKIMAREVVGEYDIYYKDLHKRFRDHDKVYPNNFAKLKYIPEGEDKNWEVGSWAYRPNGLLSTHQVHLMVYSTEDSTIVAAHYELSPLARPIRHYMGHDVYDIERGVRKAQKVMSEAMLSA